VAWSIDSLSSRFYVNVINVKALSEESQITDRVGL
jgi:hypothetical protein